MVKRKSVSLLFCHTTYMGITDFKKGYQPGTNIVKDEMGDLVADFHSVLARWRNHLSQLLNIHGVNDVSQKYTQQNH